MITEREQALAEAYFFGMNDRWNSTDVRKPTLEGDVQRMYDETRGSENLIKAQSDWIKNYLETNKL